MIKGGHGQTNQLHDINWGTAAHVHPLMLCNYCVRVCVCVCTCVCVYESERDRVHVCMRGSELIVHTQRS